MSEQPTNLPEEAECPTDDEVLAKRDAEITRLRNIIKFRVLGWREHDWPEGFDRRTAEMIADNVRAALAQSSLDKPSRVGYGIAAAPTQEKLLAAMRWIDTFEPETTAAAEAKFGFKLFS
jgi:hypothetical protein